MANLIIKPTSGGSLILQDEGGTAANTIDASGNTQLAGTLGVTGNTTLSGTANNLGTATAGNISNTAIIYPAGHVVKQSFIGDEAVASTGGITTTSSSYVDSGIECTHVTARSSTDSYLIAEYYTGMMNVTASQSASRYNVTMRTVSNSTYTAAESITDNSYPSYIEAIAGDMYFPLFFRNYCGLVSEMGMPATKSTWAAGDTLYFRIFIMVAQNTFRLCHQNSVWNFTIKEVLR